MLGNALLYAASRATSSAVDNISRYAMWVVVASVFLVCGLVFGLLVAFWLLEPEVGTLNAAGLIAIGCAVAGLICLAIPGLVAWVQRVRKPPESPVAATVAVVEEEAREAVDYFGALQVVATAFMLGLGTARRLKRS
jgi:hypothetical protein